MTPTEIPKGEFLTNVVCYVINVCMKIYILEDNDCEIEIIKMHCENKGIELVGSSMSGDVPISEILGSGCDVLLSDVLLGNGRDGVDVVRDLRLESDIPVVFMTGHFNSIVWDKVQTVDFDHLLIKPITSDQLECSLDIALRKYNQNKKD